MALPIKEVLGILSDNLEKRKAILPLPMEKATAWARGLDIPYGGETVLYTGHMYQLIPSITTMATSLERFENSWITRFFAMGRVLNRAINVSRFMAYRHQREERAYNTILRNIARLLRASGVEFGYLYGEELYSGAILYDQGVDDVFTTQARRVNALLQKKGVRQVIAVDPHTTHMFRSVYRTVINDYRVEVKSYLELLAERDPECVRQLDLDLVIHDSCIYARFEEVVGQPRELLRKAGARLHEPELSGRLTHCCGGPIESLFPGRAQEIAKKRTEQLAGCGDSVATMCPICMANIKRASIPGLKVRDISEYLVAAYCPGASMLQGYTRKHSSRKNQFRERGPVS
jgi:Fe-S oxidoreductase